MPFGDGKGTGHNGNPPTRMLVGFVVLLGLCVALFIGYLRVTGKS